VKPNLEKSFSLWNEALRYIPSGTQTLSKGPSQFVKGVYPIYLQRGKGAYVWDVDGNRYIDYPMALGAILLGHAHPKVTEAVTRQLEDGNLFTLMHPKEIELARRLCEMIPCAEKVRFGKNGADATSAAVRCARALTGREEVAYCGYHGYQDWYAAIHPMSKGVPQVLKQYMHEFIYNDLESLKRVFLEHSGKIACVIMEQPTTEPNNDFLQKCIDLAHQNGAFFILDEIVTGFRYANGGAQEHYHIKPDLACVGKGLANGFPLSAVVGSSEVMKEFENIFYSTTSGGEVASLTAALTVTDCILKEGVIEHLWELGNYWMRSFQEIATGMPVKLLGCAPRTVFEFKDLKGEVSNDLRSLFIQETCKQGILFGVPIFMSFSHTKSDIDQTVEACEKALKVCKKALEEDAEENAIDKYMEGEKIGQLFRPQPKTHA